MCLHVFCYLAGEGSSREGVRGRVKPPPREFSENLDPGSTDFGDPFWLPFGSGFGVIFRHFFGSALGATSGRLRAVLDPFWLNFGAVFGLFWGTLRKVKIELSLKRELHF